MLYVSIEKPANSRVSGVMIHPDTRFTPSHESLDLTDMFLFLKIMQIYDDKKTENYLYCCYHYYCNIMYKQMINAINKLHV